MSSSSKQQPEATPTSVPTGPAGRPRWVKVFGLVVVVLIVLVVVLQLVGGGNHGPGRHQRDHGSSGAPASGSMGIGSWPSWGERG